jgi:hypothetical protein
MSHPSARDLSGLWPIRDKRIPCSGILFHFLVITSYYEPLAVAERHDSMLIDSYGSITRA